MKSAIILYEIGLDGTLNGSYTNDGEIYNEMAKLISPANVKKGALLDIVGEYSCVYIEKGNKLVDAHLKIARDPADTDTNLNSNVYSLQWNELDGTPIFRGTGYRINSHQLVAHYWFVDKQGNVLPECRL